jgi:hypothetical protein
MSILDLSNEEREKYLAFYNQHSRKVSKSGSVHILPVKLEKLPRFLKYGAKEADIALEVAISLEWHKEFNPEYAYIHIEERAYSIDQIAQPFADSSIFAQEKTLLYRAAFKQDHIQ